MSIKNKPQTAETATASSKPVIKLTSSQVARLSTGHVINLKSVKISL